MSYFASPVPPTWTTLILTVGSSCVMVWVMLSGGGIGPKSLLPAFSFQVPPKSDLACACTRATATNNSVKQIIWYIDLRIGNLLLFFENHFHIHLAHGARQMPGNGQGLAIARKLPVVLGCKLCPTERSLGVDHYLIAVPFAGALEFILADLIGGFLAVGAIRDVVSLVAHHASGRDHVGFQV